jgi:hypothetical protein
VAEVRAEDGHECKHEWADYGFQLVPQCGVSQGAYLALTVDNVLSSMDHAFNIALLLAVDPPTAQEAQTKPGAQWEAARIFSRSVRL